MLLQILDNGPVYAETLTGHPPFYEPWNSLSSLFIAGAGLLFFFKTKRSDKGAGFIYFCATMLLVGGLGSTLFHGLRTSYWLVFMDFMPIIIVSLAIALLFWQKVLKSWTLASIVLLGLMALRAVPYWQQEHLQLTNQAIINISYFIAGLTIFLPCLIFLVQSRLYKSTYLFLAIGLMIAALVFRTIDKDVTAVLPMGTHFLWHVASGVGAYYMGLYMQAILALPHKSHAVEKSLST
jgi:hemolysin III